MNCYEIRRQLEAAQMALEEAEFEAEKHPDSPTQWDYAYELECRRDDLQDDLDDCLSEDERER